MPIKSKSSKVILKKKILISANSSMTTNGMNWIETKLVTFGETMEKKKNGIGVLNAVIGFMS